MPREEFERDLHSASRPFRFSHLSNIQQGEVLGAVYFSFRFDGEVESEQQLKVTISGVYHFA
jgi:hypothetical protein